MSALVLILAVAHYIGSCAPTDYSRPVPVSTINTSTILGDPCAYQGYGAGSTGYIARVTAVNSSGPYTLYEVTCSNGVTIDVAQ